MTARAAVQRSNQQLRMGELLLAFAYASDLAYGLQLEDSVRSCYLALRLARQLGLSEAECRSAYYTALLKDAGCTAWTTEEAGAWRTDEIVARRELMIFGNPLETRAFISWMRHYVAKDDAGPRRLARYANVLATSRGFLGEGFSVTCKIARRIAARLGLPDEIQDATLSLFEFWDGKGMPHGLAGTAVPMVSRVVLPTFWVVPFHRVGGREAAVEVAGRFRETVFDPAVVDALKELSRDETFWAEFEAHDIRDRVLALEPESDWRLVDEARIEDVALAFADFIDLKSRYKAAHSRRVGAIAEQLARIMRCAEEAVTQIRRAGLMHDLGVVAIPSYSLDRPWRELSESERDACRLYPYHGERILKRVPALAPLAEMVGTHQERMDGSGYYRGMSGQQISLGARIIAVADRLDELTHDGAANTALPVTQALDVLASEPLDQEVLGALRRSLGEQAIVVAAPPRHPASLTDREIEVLTLMTQGMTRREIGHRLAISEHTVRNHLDHIYDKTGTSNRVSATMFAMENGILAP